jgi:HlyD family secretion protein
MKPLTFFWLLASAGMLGCGSAAAPPARPEPGTVRSLGRLEPTGGVISVGVPLGDRIQQVLVTEGQMVEQDQELAILDSKTDREAELALARSQLEEARSRLAAITASGAKQIEEGKLKIRQIRELEPLAIEAQKERVKLAEEQLSITALGLTDLKALPSGVAPAQEVRRQDLAMAQARAELTTARTLLTKAERAYDLELQSAEVQLEMLERSLDRACKEIPLQSLENSVRVAEERLRHTTIRAPAPGVILQVLGRPGELAGTQPILRMGDIRQMVAVAEVYETDSKRVRVGQKAAIRSKALPLGTNEALTGVVERIGDIVARNTMLDVNPAEDADRRVIEVKVRLDNSTAASHYVNLNVHVSIAVEDGVAP